MDSTQEFIILLVFASLISASCSSVSCYSCYHDLYNQRNDRCDVIDRNGTFAVTCPFNPDRNSRDTCTVVKRKNCRTGERIVKRSCGTSADKFTDEDCRTRHEGQWLIKECRCKGNLCNGSSPRSLTMTFTFLREFVALFLALNL